MLLQHSATVIDGMAIVWKVNGNKKTLRAISNAVLATALAEAEDSVRIDIVFDVYIVPLLQLPMHDKSYVMIARYNVFIVHCMQGGMIQHM